MLGFLLFSKFLKYWKLKHKKNFIFNTTAKRNYRAGEMDSKVEGPWKTEMYCRPTLVTAFQQPFNSFCFENCSCSFFLGFPFFILLRKKVWGVGAWPPGPHGVAGNELMSRTMVFWSDHEVKMLRDVAFRLNREIKMSQDSKIVQKTEKFKFRKNFMPQKTLALKYLSSVIKTQNLILETKIFVSRITFCVFIQFHKPSIMQVK